MRCELGSELLIVNAPTQSRLVGRALRLCKHDKRGYNKYIVSRHNHNGTHRNGSRRSERVTEQDYRALAQFRYHVRRFWRLTEGNARRAGIHPQQHRLLLSIKGMKDDEVPSVGRLAERLQVQHHSAVELIDRTVAAGLVVRRRDSSDGRVVTVRVTPRGERLLERLSRENREELRLAAPALVKALRALTRSAKL